MYIVSEDSLLGRMITKECNLYFEQIKKKYIKTPIERIDEYLADRDTESRNPISLLKELKARIIQDNSISH